MDDPLVSDLVKIVTQIYGWKSDKVKSSIGLSIEAVRADERKKFARVLYQVLLDHLHLPVVEIVQRIKRNELRCSRDDVAEQQQKQYY